MTELSLAATLRLCRYAFLKNFRRKERRRTRGAATFFQVELKSLTGFGDNLIS